MGSDRSFGVVFATVFVIVGLAPLVFSDRGPRWWALGIAAIFAAAAALAPQILHPLNRVWFRLGLFLHHVINPVVMAFLYYGAMGPMGLLLRALGKDLLRLKADPAAQTYWISREPAGPSPGSMSKQF
jgi:hypothetical protein